MPSSLLIKPLSEVPADQVKSYLARQGMSAEIADWKYYDAQFNRGRPRGCAGVRDGEVLGFLGLIPFRFNGLADAAWCCDWSIDASRSGTGAGIMLLKYAQGLYQSSFGIEGSEITRPIFPRLATAAFPDAGVRMQLNLRFGAYTQKISNRLPIFSWKGWPPVDQIPLRIVEHPSKRPVRMERGISTEIVPLLEAFNREPGRPAYDMDYIEWQIARCPTLTSYTCYFPEASPPKAAIVYWRSVFKNSWRISIWALNTAWEQVPALLSNVIWKIYKNRGTLVSIAVSRRNTALIEILTRAGFSPWPESMPLYVFTSRRVEVVPELSHLSYLDCDLAYRF